MKTLLIINLSTFPKSDGWTEYTSIDKWVYNSYINGQEQLNFNDAQAKCKRLNSRANLISITTESEDKALEGAVKTTRADEGINFWIGGRYLPNTGI